MAGSRQFPGATAPFNGLIDEVSLYNRALTDVEIASIFNAGIAGKLKSATTPTGFSIADLQNSVNIFSPQVVNTTIGDATVTFPTVTTAGTTQQIPLNTALFPALPMGTHTGLAYDIATSAVFTGNPTVCFNVPSFTPAQFTNLRVFHFEAGAWINRTATSNTFPTLCTQGLTSLSPFAIVQVNAVATSTATAERTRRFFVPQPDNGLLSIPQLMP